MDSKPPSRWPPRHEGLQQDSGLFALGHPYRSRAPEIHDLLLAWLLGEEETVPPYGWHEVGQWAV